MTPGWAYYRDLSQRRWRPLVIALVTGVASSAGCSVLILSLIQRQLSGPGETSGWLPALYAGSILLYMSVSSLSEYLILTVSQDERRDLSLRLVRRILEMPYEKVEALGSARIAASLTDDIHKVTDSISRLTTVILNGSLLLGVGIYLAWLSPPLLAATVVLVFVGWRMYSWPLRRLKILEVYWERLRHGHDRLMIHFEGLSRGTKELLMHEDRRREFVDGAVRTNLDEIRDNDVRSNTWKAAMHRTGDMLYYAILGLVLFALPRFESVEPTVLSGFVIGGLYALVPLGSILNFGPDFGAARTALKRLQGLGVLVDPASTRPPPDREDRTLGIHGGTSSGGTPSPPTVRFEGVTYRYLSENDETPFQLGPIDLELRPGELTFLTGGNGSGKSTLFKLLCGLYPPTSGGIVLDGTPLTPDRVDDYRRRFSAVFTDFHLFDRLYGLDPVEVDRRAGPLLERLDLSHKVTVRNGRLSTTDLSEGQRKRLALLTAWLEDRPALLFDEWAADQDPEFKAYFYTELLTELTAEGRTVLAITHDDRWYGVADRILKLVDGRLVEDRPAAGTP